MDIRSLQPAPLWNHFADLNAVPRGSKKEQRVIEFIKNFGEKLGLPIDQQPEDRHAVTRKLGAFKTSMLQDVEASKPLEIDALVGAVRELGQITSTPTPHTDALLGLVRLMARTRGLY